MAHRTFLLTISRLSLRRITHNENINNAIISTFRAISKQACRLYGRFTIKFQTVPRPCVTRSISGVSFPRLSVISQEQSLCNSSKVESGKTGTSPRSLLKDLSEAGKASSNDLAYN